MSDFCQCGIPWLSGDICEKCNKQVDPKRVNLVKNSQSEPKALNQSIISIPKSSKIEITEDMGIIAAERVNHYGSLFEKIGAVLQILNIIAAILLVIILMFAGLKGSYLLLGLLGVGLIWCISYLQTSLIRGLASYFQMRSIDYLERRRSS